MNQGTGESVRQSPDYEWTDMCRSKEYRKPKNVETTVGYMTVENGVRRGQMIVMYGLGDGIVLVETGNVIKTRLDRHP